MATKNFTINKLVLTPTPADPIQAMIQYKYYLDPTFTLVTANVTINTDGTLAIPQTIVVNTSENYIIRATNLLCGDYYDEMIMFPCTPTCPAGYQLSEDGTFCYMNTTVAATPPTGGNAALAVAVTNISYDTCGSYIFSAGYDVNGTGSATQIPTSNPFWVNGSGSCVDATLTDGPMNRGAIWISAVMSNQTVGFAVCITVPDAATVFVSVGADNYSIIDVNGINILTQDPVALFGQFPMAGPNAAPFKVNCIYPVGLQAGTSILQMTGFNVSGPAAMFAEVYLNTAAEIAAATSYADLNLLFSTKNTVGQPIDVGSAGSGYSCPAGYSLQTCSSPFVCVKQLTIDPSC